MIPWTFGHDGSTLPPKLLLSLSGGVTGRISKIICFTNWQNRPNKQVHKINGYFLGTSLGPGPWPYVNSKRGSIEKAFLWIH